MLLREVLIRDWMTSEVLSASPDMQITTAHQIMKKNRIRRLPVLDEAGVLHGIVTIGDVREASPSGATTLSIWELNYLWSQLSVKDVMSHKVLTVRAEEPMISAAKLMLENKISGLPVVDENNVVVGILTESDVFRMVVRAQTDEIEI
jgi:acetoin utilization protein AcuB